MSTMTDLRPSQQRVVEALARAGEASRSELAQRLGLSKGTLAGLVVELVDLGIVTEAPPAARTGAGRPARVLTLTGRPRAVGAMSWSFGLLSVGVVTLAGSLVVVRELSLAADLDRNTMLERVHRSLARCAKEAGYTVDELVAVVLGIPAPFQRGQVFARRHAKTAAWLGADLVDDLEQRFGLPAFVENDANLSALAEHVLGAGQGKSHLVVVKVGGRGVGAGLILGGRLYRGTTGLAGELAHVQMVEDGPLCFCGGRGCLTRIIGTDLIDLAQAAYDEPLTFATILELAADGDVGLQRLLVDVGRTIGRPLADLCTLLNPDLFILDGALGPAGQHILAGMAEAIERYSRPATSAVAQVVPGTVAEHADLLGAAVLAAQATTRR